MKKLIAAVVLLGGAASAASPLLITGAGATFPYPLYSKWFSEYNRLHPDLRFNYQSIGSGGGIQQVIKGTVDFGASDALMTSEEAAQAPDVIQIPTVLGSVAVVYNLPQKDLKLGPETLSGIFLGRITKWNDPAIAKENPGAALPDSAVAVIHRSDGSGTTAIFTDYLAKISPEWKSAVGAGKSVKWPAGLGAKGNEGVTGLVKQTPGAIGYVELAYADQNKLSRAALRNRQNVYVQPTIESTAEAAADVTIPDDFRVSIVDPPGKGAYPIASFTYLLVHKNQPDKEKGEALVRFLWWAVHQGQAMAAPLGYGPLPRNVVGKIETTLRRLTVQGKPIELPRAQ
jgi:phosphate transport system substrate-binding protein